MIEGLIARFGINVFKYLAFAFGLLASVLAFAVHERNQGAAKAVAKIEKATNHVITKSNEAAQRSRDPNATRMRDPYTVD
jgi:hypothetical protein